METIVREEIDRTRAELENERQSRRIAESELETALQHVAQRDGRLIELQGHLDQRDSQIEELQQRLDQRDSQIEELQQEARFFNFSAWNILKQSSIGGCQPVMADYPAAARWRPRYETRCDAAPSTR